MRLSHLLACAGAFVSFAIYGSASAATDKSQCDPFLVKDVDIQNDDHFAALSAFSLMTQSDLDSIKAGGGASANFPIDSIPIKAMVRIDELKTHLHNGLSAYSSASTVSDHRSVYTAHTSDNQLAAYQACLKTLVGVWVTPVRAAGGGDTAAIVVTTHIPTGDAHSGGVRVEFVTVNSTVGTTDANHDGSITLSNDTEKTFTVRRQNDAGESMVGVNAGGFSDRTWILWKLPPAPPPAPTPVTYSVIKCEVQPEPSHAAPPPIDISSGALSACRHFTDGVAPGIIYRFQIHCLDQSGGTMGMGAINHDEWPAGCVVHDSQK